jgi:hypothetical protein
MPATEAGHLYLLCVSEILFYAVLDCVMFFLLRCKGQKSLPSLLTVVVMNFTFLHVVGVLTWHWCSMQQNAYHKYEFWII